MKSEEKRKDIRIPILNESVELFSADGVYIKGELKDISQSGAFVYIDPIFKPNTQIFFKIKLPGDLGFSTFEGNIVRVEWVKSKKKRPGIAVEFNQNMSELVNRTFTAWITYIRNKQIISVSRKILEDFFGPKNDN